MKLKDIVNEKNDVRKYMSLELLNPILRLLDTRF